MYTYIYTHIYIYYIYIHIYIFLRKIFAYDIWIVHSNTLLNVPSNQRFQICRQSWNAAKRPLVSQRWSGSLGENMGDSGGSVVGSLISEISEGLSWVEIRWVSGGHDEFYVHVCFGLQVPVFIHLQEKMTGWIAGWLFLPLWIYVNMGVPSLMCHAGWWTFLQLSSIVWWVKWAGSSQDDKTFGAFGRGSSFALF